MCEIKKGFDVIDRSADGVVIHFAKPPHFKHPAVFNKESRQLQKIARFGDKRKFTLEEMVRIIPLNVNGESIQVARRSITIKNKELAKAFFELCKRGGANPSLRPDNDTKRKAGGIRK